MTRAIAAIVVNYGTPDLAIRAVESLRGEEPTPEIHLVDNGSPGDDALRFAEAHERRDWGEGVTIWPSKENLGFGRGNNLAIEALLSRDAPPFGILLLNPDAEVVRGAVGILAEALEAVPGAGAAGAAVISPGGTPLAAAFRFPSLASEMLRTANFGPLDRLFGKRLPEVHPGGMVDWVSGAAVMFRSSALEDAGAFDPDFFLYFEETELMHRLAGKGWSILHVPEARVTHAEGAATGGGGRRRDAPTYLYDSWRLYHLKTAGRAQALLRALLVVPAAVFNVAHRRLRGREPTIPRAFFREHWTRVIRPLLTGGG